MEKLYKKIEEIGQLSSLYGQDFMLSWNKSGGDMRVLVSIADIIKEMYANNISPRVFDSGMAAALIKNGSLQCQTSYAFAANMLGLEFTNLDYSYFKDFSKVDMEARVNLLSFLTEFIGISDDMQVKDAQMYFGEIAKILDNSHKAGILAHRPGLINLHSYQEFPTQSISDAMFLEQKFGRSSGLRKKKLVVSWAYSPDFSNSISAPQSTITMMSRLGMHIELCHPEGYDLSPEAVKVAQRMAKYSGGTFDISHSMEKSLKDADIVYPRNWVPHNILEKHTELLAKNENEQAENLENEYFENTKKYINWEYNEEKEKLTKNANALVMNSFPMMISQKNVEHGEISQYIYDKCKTNAYMQASYRPYVIAAMMLGYKFEHPCLVLKDIIDANKKRILAN